MNCYLADAKDGFILFDTGGHLVTDKQFDNRREKLTAALHREGCRPGNLKLVVLTHGDIDHAASAAYIRSAYGAPIAMHPGDARLVESPGIDQAMESYHYRPLAFRIVFLLMRKAIKKATERILGDFEPFTPDIWLKEGDSLAEYGLDATVMHLPGHTAGSIGILTGDGDLIAGDTFAKMKKPDIAPNAADFKSLKASVDRVKAMGIGTVYPGHGDPFEMAEMT